MTDLDTAHKVCTPNELAAYQLHARGLSQRAIALALHISRINVRDRLASAQRKIDAARKENAA